MYGQYLGAVEKKGVNPPLCVVREVWVSKIYPFQDILFTTLWKGEEN